MANPRQVESSLSAAKIQLLTILTVSYGYKHMEIYAFSFKFLGKYPGYSLGFNYIFGENVNTWWLTITS